MPFATRLWCFAAPCGSSVGGGTAGGAEVGALIAVGIATTSAGSISEQSGADNGG